MRLPLTQNQELVYQYISGYIARHDYPPLIKEIQRELNFANPGTVHKCIAALESKGWLKRDKGKHRGVSLLEGGI